MHPIGSLFDNNRNWVDQRKRSDPEFFSRLINQQRPAYLWIGCSDSRVPPNEIVGLNPGELFVHRNVGNLVIDHDLNAMSVIQFAVEVLSVEHIIVCGHHGCGGVESAMRDQTSWVTGNPIDDWVRTIRDVYEHHKEELSEIETHPDRVNRLSELNVVAQVTSLSRCSIVRGAWDRGQTLSVHGWIYGLRDGLLKDLNISVTDGATNT